jgi:hypothetical protein
MKEKEVTDIMSVHYIMSIITRRYLYAYYIVPETKEIKMKYPKGIIESDEPNVIKFKKSKIINPHAIPVEVQCCGTFEDRGFLLYSTYDWQIITDENGELILVCTEKS